MKPRRPLLLVLLGSGALLALFWAIAPMLVPLDGLDMPGSSVIVVDREGRPLAEIETAAGRHRPVALEDIAPVLVAATIAIEDQRFSQHPGIDPLALVRASVGMVTGQPSGASTLTQQLVRTAWLDPHERADRSLARKLKEAALAILLERRLSKAEILAAYLNSVPYGSRATGIEAASFAYFGKPAAQLDLAEAALLAGLPQAPDRLDPRRDFVAAKARQALVLERMVATGAITREEAATAAREPLQFSPDLALVRAPHLVLGSRERVAALADAVGGSRAVTTIDAGLQQLAEATIARHLARLARERVTNAALVALDPATGEILALAGSANYFDPAIDGQVNVATSPRQPGSAIKPLTYAAAFEAGYSPATVLYDVRSVFTTRRGERFVPVNYDHQYHGPMSLRTALASSINVVAVQLLDRIGVTALLDTGQRLGLTTWQDTDRFDFALTLGGGEVTLLELTAAYGAFADGGRYRQPTDLLRIESAEGEALWLPAERPVRQALTPETAFLVTHILADPQARELGFGMAGPLLLSRPAAVKTGTTAAFRDNWTIGYTPDLVVGVWVGNSNGESMREVTGVSGAAPIWHDFMDEALDGRPVRQFVVPETIRWVEVCEIDGLLAAPPCPRRTVEPVVSGREPVEVSASYQTVALDRASGQRWEPGCPGAPVDRIFWVVPFEALDWARERGIPSAPEVSCLGGRRPSGAVVRLVEPDDGAQFVVSARLPREMQRLRVRASAAGGDIWLFVDGVPLGPAGEAEGWWTLLPGEHRVRASLVRDGIELASDERMISVTGSAGE
ncbi:MAG: penicillin-binding protein 1C [Dehalococcoidia bacterium]